MHVCMFTCVYKHVHIYRSIHHCVCLSILPSKALALLCNTGIAGMHVHVWFLLRALEIQTTVFMLIHKPPMMHLFRKNHDLQLVVFILTYFSFISLCPLAFCLPLVDQICLFSQIPFFLQVMGILSQSLLLLQSLPFSWFFSSFMTSPHTYTLIHKLSSQKNKYKWPIGICKKCLTSLTIREMHI